MALWREKASHQSLLFLYTMSNPAWGNNNQQKIYKEAKRDVSLLWLRILGLLVRIIGPKKTKTLITLCLILLAVSSFLKFFGINPFISARIIDSKEESKIDFISPNTFQEIAQKEVPLERERVLAIEKNPCSGKVVETAVELDDIWGDEKLIHPDPSDQTVVSAPKNDKFQGAKRYPFDCIAPWIATASATPRNLDSIGLFVEYEEIFKILVGDGDRKTWKLEKNENGRRESWEIVTRESLINGPISVNKQFSIVVRAIPIKEGLTLSIKFDYVPAGKNKYVSEIHEVSVLNPLAIDLDSNPSHAFRIGINDWRFKGEGSEVKLGTFSVKSL